MVQLGHKDQNPNSILYTQTPYHASGILKKLSYVTQDMKNAHTSKMVWPRCTKVKTWVHEDVPLPFSQEPCATFNLKTKFLCS